MHGVAHQTIWYVTYITRGSSQSLFVPGLWWAQRAARNLPLLATRLIEHIPTTLCLQISQPFFLPRSQELIATSRIKVRIMQNQQMKQIQQIIQDRYIDPARLQTMLASKFPPGSFSMTVSAFPYSFFFSQNNSTSNVHPPYQWKLNRWIISAPRALTDVNPTFPLSLTRANDSYRLTPNRRNLMILPFKKSDPDLDDLVRDRKC